MTGIRLRQSVRKIVPLFILAALPVLTVLPVRADAQADPALLGQVDDLLDDGSYSEAIPILRQALEALPDSYDLLYRLSDALTEHARDLDEDEAEPVYEESLTFARRATEVRAGHAEGWFMLGKALGRLALFRGGKEKVNMSKDVKEAFEQAIELDSEHAGAIHGLARWHREVANLSWVLKTAAKIIYGGLPPASNEEAVRLFERAIELEPDHINHHLELGKTWLEMKEKDRARAELEIAVSLPPTEPDDDRNLEEAEQLLAGIRR